MRPQMRKVMKKALLLGLALLTALLLPVSAGAKGAGKTVRVGWFDSPFNTIDEFGRRAGYAYDYQQKLAAYSGWTYEYVEGSWPELMEMLSDGRIDLLSDVSYTQERAERILYSSAPMGSEEYDLFVAPGKTTITAEDFSSFNGKRIGANKGSVQIALYRDWARANGVDAQLVELTGSEEENVARLARGDIDLYLTLEGFCSKEDGVPVCRIGSSDFYFGVSQNRPDLLVELNNAMSRILDENEFYNQALYSKYLQNSGTHRFLSAEESAWLDSHGPIKVGYQDHYLAFCARDDRTGALTGALEDYLNAAFDCMENAHLEFEPVCYPSSAAAIEALKEGEVDCVFPVNLTSYDGENAGVFVTPALMRTDMSAVIREADRETFDKKDRVTVAVNADNPNYDMFLLDHFPEWRAIYYKDTPECLKAISEGQADCLLMSYYRYNNISKLCEKYHLTTCSTGVAMDYCFAVGRNDPILYSILAKTTAAVPESTVNAALTRHFSEDARDTGSTQPWEGAAQGAAGGAALVLMVLLLYSAGRKRAGANRRRAPSAEDFRVLDELPLSCSIYHVTHAGHGGACDAVVLYVNRRFEEYGGVTARTTLGRRVRDLFPYIGEDWYENARRAALDGERVECEFVYPVSGKHYHCTVRQIGTRGYCLITYQEA